MGDSLHVMISGVPESNVQCHSVSIVSWWSSPTDNHTAWTTDYKILIYISKGVLVLQTEPTGCVYRFIIRDWIVWIWRQVPRSARWITDWGPGKANGFFLVCVRRPENQEAWCSSYLGARPRKNQCSSSSLKWRCKEVVFWGTCARWAKGTKAHRS